MTCCAPRILRTAPAPTLRDNERQITTVFAPNNFRAFASFTQRRPAR
jgi:hypothetical protein